MATYYLYGFSIQGIQSFIFETNKLREIVGGSEFVEQACEFKFLEAFEAIGGFKKEQRIVNAAGKVVYLFKDKSNCEHIVKHFLRGLKREIPDLNASQAVIRLEGTLDSNTLFQLDALLEAQRNKKPQAHGAGWMISGRARRTGKAGIKIDEKFESTDDRIHVIDRSQVAKEKYKAYGNESLMIKFSSRPDVIFEESNLPLEVDNITKGREPAWLAIVHTDGNGLGRTIQKLISHSKEKGHEVEKKLSLFSKQLKKATKQAAQRAFKASVWDTFQQEGGKFLPMRPILLGGDDLTILLRGDLAFDFTRLYLEYFEEETTRALAELGPDFLKDGLTACAGIAYIKPHYPIHYGVDLAESLTKHSKKIAKDMARQHGKNTIPPAALAFHKVQSSFIEKDYNKIVERELTVGSDDNSISFDFGPYFLNGEQRYILPTLDNKDKRQEDQEYVVYPSIRQLEQWVEIIQKEDAPKARLRNWLSELHESEASAEQLLKRIRSLTRMRYIEDLHLDYPFGKNNGLQQRARIKQKLYCNQSKLPQSYRVTHLYDVLSLASI